MKLALTLFVIACAAGLAGCATNEGYTDYRPSVSDKAGTTGARTMTGSRLPDNPPRDRLLRRVSREEWVRDDRSGVITFQDPNVK